MPTLRSLSVDEVRFTGGFWGDLQAGNADVTLAHCEQWLERAGWLGNFDAARAGKPFPRAGFVFADSEVYKLLEAMAWELSRRPDPKLRERYERLVDRIEPVQEADGYLGTAFGRPGQPPRYSDLEEGHELYCLGHLIQAGVARLRTGQDDRLAAMARRAADHVVRTFGPDGRVGICGHPEIELAMAELGRVDGRPDYLETARVLIDRRGHGVLAPHAYGPEYFQDDMPVRAARVLRGHAVRALYLAAGAYETAVTGADAALAAAVERQWVATVARRTHLTGGMGSRHEDEAFGADYELPPDHAYAETCAAVASVMLSWRILLNTGRPDAADLIERTLLNAVLAGRSADGHTYFYVNPLQQREPGRPAASDRVAPRTLYGVRAPWFTVSCCPTNLARTLASAQLYMATADDDGVQIHQYGQAAIDTHLPDGRHVALAVDTGYPFDGDVSIRFTGPEPATFTLTLRVPAWAGDAARVRVDGAEQPAPAGPLALRRRFAPGDTVTLHLPVEARVTRPHPRIDALRGQIAVERGPMVLCLESEDLPATWSTEDVALDLAAGLTTTDTGAEVVLTQQRDPGAGWAYGDIPADAGPASSVSVRLIPYARWGNRRPSTMRVWMPDAAHDGAPVNDQTKSPRKEER
jgi:uncharacterized protein